MQSHRCQFTLRRLEEKHNTAVEMKIRSSLISSSANLWGQSVPPCLMCIKEHGTGAGLGSLLIHFVLNLGQVTKLPDAWVFFQDWMFILSCSLTFRYSFKPCKVRGNQLTLRQNRGSWVTPLDLMHLISSGPVTF